MRLRVVDGELLERWARHAQSGRFLFGAFDIPMSKSEIPDKIRICPKRDRCRHTDALRIKMLCGELIREMPKGSNNQRNEVLMRVRINLKHVVWIAVLTLGIGITGGMVRVAASPSPQDQHDQDYSRNKNYQQGMRDGRDDNAHKRDHFKKRKFKKDDDQRVYEIGYQFGHQGNSSDRR
jgi:hypothetical protein